LEDSFGVNGLTQETDQALIRLTLEGESAAFDTLMGRYRAGLMTTVMRIVHNHEDAEDVVQDTFLRAFRHLDRYDEEKAAFHSWLWTIGWRRALQCKQRKRNSDVSIDDNRTVTQSDAFLARGASEDLDVRREYESVLRTIDRMPELFRRTITLYAIEGMEQPQIANMIGIPLGTVGSRIYRGRRWLREHLEERVA
jgi:RNA polymerase sigma-70 factor, ECF subfamily